MANSQPVSPGDGATAAQYNALRADVLDPQTGHAHSGAPDDGAVLANSTDEHFAYAGFAPDSGL